MQLLVVRHAIAEERAEFARTGRPDSERPLTRDGAKKMRKNAKGLEHLVERIDLLATSPFTRARQTADIVHRRFPDASLEATDVLQPERHPRAFFEWLARRTGNDTVAAVGHEPHLGILVSYALAERTDSFVALKKGGACLITFDGEPAAARGRLAWFLTPAQLRRLR